MYMRLLIMHLKWNDCWKKKFDMKKCKSHVMNCVTA